MIGVFLLVPVPDVGDHRQLVPGDQPIVGTAGFVPAGGGTGEFVEEVVFIQNFHLEREIGRCAEPVCSFLQIPP
jgi:hypothetical protein